METKHPLDLTFPVVVAEPESMRIIMPNENGNAFGKERDYLTDTAAVAITAALNGIAKSPLYGVAYATNNGTAEAGARGAAVVHYGGKATAGDGGMAYAWYGDAEAAQWATAHAMEGNAQMTNDGVAVVMLKGSAKVALGGVACALNLAIKLFPGMKDPCTITDPTAGKVSGGKDSVVVAFKSEKEIGTPRIPVVGIIGERPPFLDQVPGLEAALLASGVQFGLTAGKTYSLCPVTGGFVEVP